MDAGVEEGSVVGVEYDPLLAKLVVSAGSRDAAIARARRALAEWVVLGVETNLPLLDAVCASELFRSGRYATDILDRIPPLGDSDPPDAAWIAAALARSEADGPTTAAAGPKGASDPWGASDSWRIGS